MNASEIFNNTIKNSQNNTINKYKLAIENMRLEKSKYNGLSREQLQAIKPSLTDYDLAINGLREKLSQILSIYDDIDFKLCQNFFEDFDYLMKTNSDIAGSEIEFVFNYLCNIQNKNIIDNKNLEKINLLLGIEFRKKIGIFSINEKQYELKENLENSGCSEDSIRLIFQTIKGSNKARLPKEPLSYKVELIDLGHNIINQSI